MLHTIDKQSGKIVAERIREIMEQAKNLQHPEGGLGTAFRANFIKQHLTDLAQQAEQGKIYTNE